MSSNNIIYNNKEINEIILLNILNMLRRRKLLKNVDEVFKSLSVTADKHIYEINLDKSKIYVYFVVSKLNSITNGSPLAEFLDSDINIHKIVVAKDVAKKVVKQIVSEFKNSEFFFESELMIDVDKVVFIPKHELLSEDEKKELLSKIPERNLAYIMSTDRMAREYNASVGDIFRITRPSVVSGKNIFYRRVINGSWDILFE
jgi:DNA-directed RNA polymerase I, II, and III subunit RPABC1